MVYINLLKQVLDTQSQIALKEYLESGATAEFWRGYDDALRNVLEYIYAPHHLILEAQRLGILREEDEIE